MVEVIKKFRSYGMEKENFKELQRNIKLLYQKSEELELNKPDTLIII